MSRHLTLCVIGHIDHGKTSLVRALTGMETDRLQEEKARGMSIVLGFAWLAFENGTIDLIDVPGHENFVRTMIGGASGMEACLLVIDAREGVRAQTEEHLAIVQLMGMETAVVVLSKCESLSITERGQTLSSIRERLKNTGLARAPFFFASSVTGEGVPEIKNHLRKILDEHVPLPAAPHFYLPIDRVFSLPGLGTIVTGTLRSGCVAVEDEVEILPLGLKSTLRKIERHGKEMERAEPGQRIGLNLRQVKVEQLSRGLVLASPGLLYPTTMMDAQLRLCEEAPRSVQHGQRVKLLFDTTEVTAQVRLLSGASLAPGEKTFVQFRLHRPVTVASQTPYILRSESPVTTLGGGRILDPLAQRCRRYDESVLGKLHRLASGDSDDIVREKLKQAGYAGLPLAEIVMLSNQSAERTSANLGMVEITWLDASYLIYTPYFETLSDMCIAALQKFHSDFPARSGAPIAYCRSSLPKEAGELLFKRVILQLEAARKIEIDEGIVRLPGYDPLSALEPVTRRLAETMEDTIRRGGTMPPDVEEITKEEGSMELLHLLVARGDLIMLPGEQMGKKIVFHHEAVQAAQQRMKEAFPSPTPFTVSEFRMLIRSTRKFTVPLLTYFDSLGMTQRQGDKRIINPSLHGGERSLVTSLVFKTSGPSHHG